MSFSETALLRARIVESQNDGDVSVVVGTFGLTVARFNRLKSGRIFWIQGIISRPVDANPEMWMGGCLER